jgi:hypothetical protein
MTETSEEWLADLKTRAVELARAGDLAHAVQIMAVEINRRADMKVHHAFVLAGTLKAMSEDTKGVIEWIESMRLAPRI